MPKSQAKVQAGKRAWARKSPAEKQKVKARLAAGRRKFSAGTKSVAKYTGHYAEKKEMKSIKGSSKHPSLAKSYQAARMGAAVLGPITTGVAIASWKGGPVPDHIMTYVNMIRSDPVPYGASLLVMAGDTLLDKRLRQTAAMARRSITAIGPELVPMLAAWGEYTKHKGEPAGLLAARANNAWNSAVSGYDPGSNTWDLSRMKNYRIAKHGGQLVRLARAKIPIVKSITDMLPLKLLGLTW